MPVVLQIANAAYSFHVNEKLLNDSAAGLTAEEWLRRPNDSSNHLLWIVGHVLWARGRALSFLGVEWSRSWGPLFARGAKLADAAEYPEPEEILLALEEVSAKLAAALEAASDDTLSKPAPQGIPSADGKIGGLINFFAHHETYHVGQVAYLRSWLGHGGLRG
jgi:uncharacterized damage-inducible protein DinB